MLDALLPHCRAALARACPPRGTPVLELILISAGPELLLVLRAMPLSRAPAWVHEQKQQEVDDAQAAKPAARRPQVRDDLSYVTSAPQQCRIGMVPLGSSWSHNPHRHPCRR